MPFDRETEVRSVSAAECFLRDYGTDGGSNRCSEKKKSTSVQLDESICGVGKKNALEDRRYGRKGIRFYGD